MIQIIESTELSRKRMTSIKLRLGENISMPVYQYKCKGCEKEFEAKMRMEDWNVTQTCPYCGEEMYRIPSKTSFELKGGGWAGSGYSKGD